MCSVYHFSFQLLSLCIAFLSCSVPVLQLRPLRVTCMTLVILLTFSSSSLTVCDLSLCLVSYALMCFSLLTPRMEARLLNVYSNVFDQWCCARWSECNLMLYVFIKLWLFLFSCCLSISLCLCYSTLLYNKFLWMPFSPRLALLLLYFYIKPMVFIRKIKTIIWAYFDSNSH